MQKCFGVLMLLLVPCGVWRWTPATFSVTNGTEQPIPFLVVRVAGEEFSFREVPPGATVSGSFRVSQEESSVVRGRFANGSEIAESAGYVTWEQFAPHIEAAVADDGSVKTR